MIKFKLMEQLSHILNLNITALETPHTASHGDYATPICFSLAKEFKKSPKLIADELCTKLNQSDQFKQIATAVATNGFINLKLTSSFIWNFLTKEPITFPKNSEKILLEYVSANPTGPLHIGHGRWAVIGSILTNLLKYTQHNVHSEFYINDAGQQVKLFYDSINAVKKGEEIPEDGYHGGYVSELAQLNNDPLTANIDHQKAVLDQLRVSFDQWFSEKTLHNNNAVQNTLNILKETGWTYEEKDALWFKSTKLGDEKDRVLIKSDGSYTYFAVDIAYHRHKLDRQFTSLVNIWGADHHGYINRVKAAVSALEKKESQNQLTIIIGQLVNLVRDGSPVRMSKRTGEMITLEEVMQEIGVDATRFFLVQYSADTHLEFDLDLAKKQSSDNPIYYIQYAHARICSIFNKLNTTPLSAYPNTLKELTEPESQLLLHLVKWPDTAWQAAIQHQPHQIAQYALKLAKQFHHFYEKCSIINVNTSIQSSRIAILSKTKETIQTVLSILGISSPTKM